MDRPKLRNVERIPLSRAGEALLVLRDPMGLAEPFAIDAEFAPVLDALDGRRTLAQVRQSLAMTGGLVLEAADFEAFVAQLGEAGLLDDDRFRERWAEAHEAFLAAPSRPPILADVLYPADPAALAQELAVLGPREALAQGGPSRAITLPHAPIDIAAPELRAALRALPPADQLDAVILLGADHHPGLLPYALCDRPYATPLGTTVIDDAIVDALRRRLPWIDREAIRHRASHSLEWAVLALQYAWGPAMPKVVPLLAGATVLGKDDRLHDAVGELVATLEALTEDARVLVVAAAELTHAGPAYGRPRVDAAGRDALDDRDREVLAALCRGRTREVLARADDRLDQGRPSGLPVFATLCELSTDLRGEVLAQRLAPLPAPAVGLVGLAAVRFVDDRRRTASP